MTFAENVGDWFKLGRSKSRLDPSQFARLESVPPIYELSGLVEHDWIEHAIGANVLNDGI